MKAEREDIEKFDAYLFGEMDEEEQLLFESKLAVDEEYASEFEVHKLLTEALSAEKEDRFRTILQQQRKDTFIGNNTWSKKFTLVSAAVVLLGALALLFATYREHNPLKKLALNKSEQQDREKTGSANESEPTFQEQDLSENTAENLNEQTNANFLNDTEIAEDEIVNNESYFDDGASLKIEMKDDQPEELDEVITTDRLIAKEEVVIAEKNISLAPVKATANAKTSASNVSTNPVKRDEATRVDDIETKAKVDRNEQDKETIEDLGSERKKVLQKDSSGTTKTNEKIVISYYKSPLNYKGYTYNERNKNLTVYGLGQTKSLLIRYNEKLYLKNGVNYYLITPTTSYVKFTKLTDTNLIKTLNN